jgi:hypothetical protein
MEQLFIRNADRVARTLYEEQNPVFLERYYLSAGTAVARKGKGKDKGKE